MTFGVSVAIRRVLLGHTVAIVCYECATPADIFS